MSCPKCGEREILEAVVDYVSDGEPWTEDAWECSRCGHKWQREDEEEAACQQS